VTSTDSSPSNILLVVWDACRLDYVREHAATLSELAEDNLWFERAIAPSPWSLPSHSSIFTGKYPHEHGCHRLDGSVDSDLAARLSERGYQTYGVSANGFASQRTGFGDGFDEFHYTGGREIYPEGLDVSGFAQNHLEKDESADVSILAATIRRSLRHDHPAKSLANVFATGLGELADSHELLQRFPHPIVSPDSGYCYSPERNTHRIQSVIQDHDGTDAPFFLFTNYMDTHRPYKPRPDLQRKHLGEQLSFRELRRLNEEVAYPWEFLKGVQDGSLSEADVETVRGLYAGEVETADEHLARLRETLEAEGILEDTLIIVTSDHGENLGETDPRGLRRMGHEASVSDAVLRVPLLVSHPELDQRTVSEPVSLKDLFGLCLDGTEELIASGGREIPGLVTEDVTASQYPATGGQKFFERHPEVDEEIIKHRVAYHSAVAYDETWKAVAESTGDQWAEHEGSEQPFAMAPDRLVDTVETHLRALQETDSEAGLADEDISQLEALGYL
jgi:arylsulfatase A-like enzyme